jgi:hypothetical protein
MWRLWRRPSTTDERACPSGVSDADSVRLHAAWHIWKELWRDEEIVMY